MPTKEPSKEVNMQYSEVVMDHFKNPRNVGTIENPDGVGEVGNPICGDMMTIAIRVKGNRIEDIKFSTFGCGAAIAVSSMVTEMARGKTLEDAMKITNESVAKNLGGLPKNELHCSHLGADALHKAIMDFYSRKKGEGVKDKKVEYIGGRKGKCYCPYCDTEIPKTTPYCNTCGKPVLNR
jgi:nitrogen fixation protein NifU and related proteins